MVRCGATPRPLYGRPVGEKKRVIVTRTPPVGAPLGPGGSGNTVCVQPLPKVFLPTRRARLFSFRAPASTSAALAVSPSISTTIGTVIALALRDWYTRLVLGSLFWVEAIMPEER